MTARPEHLSFKLHRTSHNQLHPVPFGQVGTFSEVMERTGSRPTIHSILHAVEAIRRHGENARMSVEVRGGTLLPRQQILWPW